MKKIKSSVIICTYNRSEYLRETIQVTLAQETSLDFEVLLIDNNSADSTEDITAPFLNDSKFRYISETEQGLSYARNRGIRNAKGEIVVFLDDDARPEKNWLEEITKVFDLDAKIAVVGGRVLPEFSAKTPEWLDKNLLTFLSCVDYGNSVMPLLHGELIVGANIAFRRSVFDQVGVFDVRLGRKGGMLLSNEEVKLRREIESRGYKIYYSGKAMVHHKIPEDRLTKDWFRERVEWQARSNAILARTGSHYAFFKMKSVVGFLFFSLRTYFKDNFSSQLSLLLYHTQMRAKNTRY